MTTIKGIVCTEFGSSFCYPLQTTFAGSTFARRYCFQSCLSDCLQRESPCDRICSNVFIWRPRARSPQTCSNLSSWPQSRHPPGPVGKLVVGFRLKGLLVWKCVTVSRFMLVYIITARNEVGARKYFQKHVSRILFTGGVLSRPTPRGMLGGLSGGVQAHTQGGRLGGLAGGSRPRGILGGLAGGIQAHTWGVRTTPGDPGPHLGPRPTPGGIQAHTWGGSGPGPGGCIPACTEANPPPPPTATAVGSTHPTGMYSCFIL